MPPLSLLMRLINVNQMANAFDVSLASIFHHFTSIFIFVSLAHGIVFQPTYLSTTGPSATALLLGNTTNIYLNLRTVSPSNRTGSVDYPSCAPEKTQWVLTKVPVGKTATSVHLRLNRSLRLCSENETDTDCCPKPLCVLETLQLSACMGDAPKTSALIQAKIYTQLLPVNDGSDNKTTIPNLYETFGSCPCDLTFQACDVRCCCDKDCSVEELRLFAFQCLSGPFGGQVSPAADYQCSAQSENSPDWFPFLCVTSPPENNPFLGFFYQGDTITPKSAPSFQRPVSSDLLPVNMYVQGSPMYTSNNQYFTIPQIVLGKCVNGAQVAFLKNFKVRCATLLHSCPTGFPLQTAPNDLRIKLKNGQGGDVMVDVIDEVAPELSEFISSKTSNAVQIDGDRLCENVTLSLDYKLYWDENGITSVILTRTVGTISIFNNVVLTTRYSAAFLNGQVTSEPNSGNPGYQVGRPVIAGNENNDIANTTIIQRNSINLWKPVSDGMCSSADKDPVLFGFNKTSGCLLPVSLQNLTQCNLLRESVRSMQEALLDATLVAKNGRPDAQSMTDWADISFMASNSSTDAEDTAGSCNGIPSHQHIQIWSRISGFVSAVPQRDIIALHISYSPSAWTLDCRGSDIAPCEYPLKTHLFPVTSSVTFMDVPVDTGPPKTRFQITFTEYDCDRNDVCWPELGFPLTRYYTGEPFSQSLAKGLILVFLFIIASVLGTPWRQIRQAWNSF
eukprot:XP_011614022.1 PREDICTED: tectonic-2 [Takifugu rubripes]